WAGSDSLAPNRSGRCLAAWQHPLPAAEIHGGGVLLCSPPSGQEMVRGPKGGESTRHLFFKIIFFFFFHYIFRMGSDEPSFSAPIRCDRRQQRFCTRRHSPESDSIRSVAASPRA